MFTKNITSMIGTVLFGAHAYLPVNSTALASFEGNGIPIVCLPENGSIDKGESTTATVTLDSAQNHSVVVVLSSSNPGLLMVPSSVTVPAYSDHASFQVNGVMTSNAKTFKAKWETGKIVTISASANGGHADAQVSVN